MEEYIWRMLKAMFWLLAAIFLCIMAYLLQGSGLLLGICFYGGTFCGLLGITKGLFVIIDYNREHKTEE